MPSPILQSCVLATIIGGVLAASPSDASRPPAQSTEAQAGAAAGKADAPSAKPAAGRTLPVITVHKTPTCGCCAVWVQHLRDSGMRVVVHDHDDLGPIKQRLGIPRGKGSCHTAEVAGYFVEGHVPAVDIRRMLTQNPKIKGLVLPGMPIGSPGMEVPGHGVEAYTVEAVQTDGSTRPYARHGGTPAKP